ncbi:hypothetical protein EG68_12558 [Paragonimus skrjabini miyazakii]|uniref:Uncharacterized protein n=1 Tax=Paragonimus skrjabini miyazakii TaxID=59628 RepID=A0A8S9YCR9_9TREM|nr:hypothetical protein EG68_12558 [Paragonimus skrjabini miyazakii]
MYRQINTDIFVPFSTVACPGVLDLTWIDAITVIAALADGNVGLCQLGNDALSIKFFPVSHHLLLSVETWNGRTCPILLLSGT